jgi:hypothetical protein
MKNPSSRQSKAQQEPTSMKTKILLKKLVPPIVALASVVVLGTSQSQVPLAPPPGPVQETWVARYNGPGNLDDGGHAIAGDNSGNVYVTGGSHGSGTDLDYGTIKYNSAGAQQWVARYNGPGNGWDRAAAIAVDSSANVYATGQSLGSGTGFDYATVKYDSAGQEQWVARYNGPGNGEDDAVAIASDSSGNVYVTGVSLGSGTGSDYATIKYDSVGQEQWVARYNGPGNGHDDAEAIAVDSSGNVYVTGRSLGSGGYFDYATVKYDSAGQEQWVARYNGPGNGHDDAEAIAVDSSGNVYVTGGSAGSDGLADYATVKYDSAGQEQWVARYNGPRAWAIALDGPGNVYVTGESEGDRHTGIDYATIKYSSGGEEQWVARYNGSGSGYDRAEAIAIDSSGNVYVTGQSVGSRHTGFDYATVKYDAAGQQQWAARYTGAGNSGEGEEAQGIVVDGSGNVYVTGASLGSGTGYDYATIKYVQNPTPTPRPRP